MDISEKKRERSTLLWAVFTLTVIGVTLSATTWQTLRRQTEVEEAHLFFSARTVFLAVENSLRRGSVREGENHLTRRTLDLFQELEQDGDVRFVGIIDPQGGGLLTAPGKETSPVQLPDAVRTGLVQDGTWSGRVKIGDDIAYVYGKQLAPTRPMHMHMMGDAPPVFLLVGIDVDRQLTAYKGFRYTTVLQTIYMTAAALFIWGLTLGFLSRRRQARKAAGLERFQAKLLDNLPDGLLTVDSTGTIRSANPAALAVLRRKPEELLGRLKTDLPEAVAGCLTSPGQASIGRHEVRQGGSHLEIITLDLADDQDNALLVILRDRTQVRRLETRLAEAEKLAAIGELAAGVAHEVRNPLSSLRGFAQYFVKKLAGKAPEEEYAKTMVREADRLNRVITDLLFLAKPKALQCAETSLGAVLDDIEGLLKLDLDRKGLRLRRDLETDSVYADAEALKQVLLNLLLNSLDAVPDNGPPLAVASGHGPDGVWIEVRDHGCGMNAAQAAKAFEPFFTAKTAGTGLGLALVKRFMLDHGGEASLTTSPGEGCTVTLRFPAAPPLGECA